MGGKFILVLIGWLLTIVTFASEPDNKPKSVLPVQEKVYLHFDNNCYFLGDTIWYKAYVVLADDNSPEPLSRILYVELLNEQGYLMERQQLRIDKQGQADGCFAICDTLFAGFYEVRAYTKWMLNFGYEPCESWHQDSWIQFDEEQGLMPWRIEDSKPAIPVPKWLAGSRVTATIYVKKEEELPIPDLRDSELPFESGAPDYAIISDTEYNLGFTIDSLAPKKNYRDYHNLFSRVLPVYSRPDTAANYMRKIMPTKITVGDYQVKWKTCEFDVKFYPEGGYLLAGHKCRVAWEAMNQQLERLNVSGVLLEDGEPIDSVRPIHAGRGLITLNVKHGRKYKVRFEFGKEKFTFDLPKAFEQGVALHVSQDSDAVKFHVGREFTKQTPLALKVFCRGKRLASFELKGKGSLEEVMYMEDLNEGVHQVVVCDTSGNVFADRLFFVNKCYESKAKVMVGGTPEPDCHRPERTSAEEPDILCVCERRGPARPYVCYRQHHDQPAA